MKESKQYLKLYTSEVRCSSNFSADTVFPSFTPLCSLSNCFSIYTQCLKFSVTSKTILVQGVYNFVIGAACLGTALKFINSAANGNKLSDEIKIYFFIPRSQVLVNIHPSNVSFFEKTIELPGSSRQLSLRSRKILQSWSPSACVSINDFLPFCESLAQNLSYQK